MDSKLVVEQMSGRWKVKHPSMQPLAEQARELVAGFDDVDFEWIPRASNARADALANKAMDGGSSPTAVGGATETADPSGATSEALSGRRMAAAVVGPAAKPDATAQETAAATTAWTGQTGGPTRLILLRHGQTELSVHRRYSGHGDPELTELGQTQAARAAREIGARLEEQDVEPAVILSSPLRRARQTAAAVAEITEAAAAGAATG